MRQHAPGCTCGEHCEVKGCNGRFVAVACIDGQQTKVCREHRDFLAGILATITNL